MITIRPHVLPRPNFPLLLLVLALLGGCATTAKGPGDTVNIKPARDIYSEGRTALQAQDYARAGKAFKSLEANYPDSPYTHQAQMELAYAYFKAGDFSSAIATADRIIRKYPDNENLDYALYLKALASFEQAAALIDRDGDTEDAILAAKTSLNYFDDLATQYPDSKYEQDADKRVAFLKEQLAQYEVAAARRDIEQGNHASAVVHARNVIENYPQTHSAADAQAIADMGYEMMSIKDAGRPADNQASAPMQSGTAAQAASPMKTESAAVDSTVAAMARASGGAMKSSAAAGEDAMAADNGPASSEDGNATASGGADEQRPAGSRPTSWILDQPGDRYTIQLISTLKNDTLEAFIAAHRLSEKTAYFRKRVNGRTWHTLIYGLYPDIATARAAIAELPEDVRRGKPWVLGIAKVQQTINDFNNTH